MKTTKWNWNTTDGIKMFSIGWIPEGEIKAIVVVIHGVGEHVKRYAHVAEAFCERGYAMIGFDLRGHGELGGPRGHARNLKVLFDDVDQFFAQVEDLYPGIPLFIYAHSLGGFLALAYVPQCKVKISGAVVTGPSL